MQHLKRTISLAPALNKTAGIWVDVLEQEIGRLYIRVADALVVTTPNHSQNVAHDLGGFKLCQLAFSLQIHMTSLNAVVCTAYIAEALGSSIPLHI